MTDNELIALLAPRMDAALLQAGWAFPVLQKDQPTQEGMPEDAGVYFELTSNDPSGWPMRREVDLKPLNFFSEVETQLHAATFQISAMVKQDVNDTTKPTAADVVSYVQRFLSHKATVRAFVAHGVNVLRVSSVRNGFFIQDTVTFEAHPNFDIVLTHSKNMAINVPAADRALPLNSGPVP